MARRVCAVLITVAATMLAGCGQSGSADDTAIDCPQTLDDLRRLESTEGLPDDVVAGVAMVHRFVDSPDVAFRGYDISITSAVMGLATEEQVMFVVSRDRLPIALGQEAVLFGRRGMRQAEVVANRNCPALAPLRR